MEKERAYFPSKLEKWKELYFGDMHFLTSAETEPIPTLYVTYLIPSM